ncbi:MAG: radical SAM protein [Magnetovibrio sp.]|nr:radical SAM protein [Magnetovibrio sp.]
MKKILLIKVPTFEYPDDVETTNASEQATFSWVLSLAMACIVGFMKRYFTGEYSLKQFDMNGVAAGKAGSLNEVGRMAIDEAAKVISETDFDVFAVSVQFLFSQQYADDIIELAKRKNPACKVIVGGGFATIFPDKSINKQNVDYSVIGEGEHTFVHILNKIWGIDDPEFAEKWPFDGYAEKLDDGNVVIVPKGMFLNNLEDLPQPFWNPEEHRKLSKVNPRASIPVMASRGCPMGCSFCSTHLAWGKKVRFRPAAQVVNEVMTTYKQYGFKHFDFVDDNITFQNDWFVDFCEKMSHVQPEDLNITFSNFDMRFLNESVLQGLKKIRVQSVTIATEAGSKEMQRQISKKLNLDRVRQIVKDIHAEGLYVHNCFIVGFPNETLAQMRETVAFARELRTESIQIWPAFPYPGTRLYDEAKALGFVTYDEEDYGSLKYRKGGIKSSEWNVEDVKAIAYDANIELNFLATPFFDTESGREILKNKSMSVATNITDHAVANIVSGFLYGEFDLNEDKQNHFYNKALSILLEKDCLFKRYMHMDYPTLNHFRNWMEINKPGSYDLVFDFIETDADRAQLAQVITASQSGV